MTEPNRSEREDAMDTQQIPLADAGEVEGSPVDAIKAIPQDWQVRAAVRGLATRMTGGLHDVPAPTRGQLRQVGEKLLAELGLSTVYLGFAMVAVDNALWAERFYAVPVNRRLLMLPKCLRDADKCQGHIDSVGLHCAACGRCDIDGLSRQAEQLGYQVIVAEGTSSVIMKVLEGEADAILGVACLNSLDESFERVSALGIPHQAVPLLSHGCSNTSCETELITQLLGAHSRGSTVMAPSYLPLLRTTRRIFEPESLANILNTCACPPSGKPEHGLLGATDTIARQWLQAGGKRLRPFITLSSYAVGRHGPAALSPEADPASFIPSFMWAVAVAIEALHKASLVHDDIEDRDPYRYGQPTLHRTHGVEVAINVGDYLIGLGYRLISMQASELGAACVADIIGRLSEAHLQLCCGQGTELIWNRQDGENLRPIDALQIGALKTGPAFEVALYTGLRAAEVPVDDKLLRQLATLVGEGYQVRNDLGDWDDTAGNKLSEGQDVLARRPTILRAFLLEAGGGPELEALLKAQHGDAVEALLDETRRLHVRYGAFDKAELLYAKLRHRSLELSEQFGGIGLRDLLHFVVRNILPERPEHRPGAAHTG